MEFSKTHRVAALATPTIDSTQKPKLSPPKPACSVPLWILACAFAIGATASTSAAQTRDEAAIRALGNDFARAFVSEQPKKPNIPVCRGGNLRDAAG